MSITTQSGEQGALRSRQAGVLLHPTSLPGAWDCGDLGSEAFNFVNFLAAAGQKVWQILPLGPTHNDLSPYQSLSAYAGNPELISIEKLVEWGWLAAEQIKKPGKQKKPPLIAKAFAAIMHAEHGEVRNEFEVFVANNSEWLEDYALYRLLKNNHQGKGWFDWPTPLRDRSESALKEVRHNNAEALAEIRFEQFLFQRQWFELKHYANERGISIFGDVPIFVAYDSADVWAHRDGFALDADGRPTVVAGVPPDYFSETGQRWGNPHYDWAQMEQDGFSWWLERMRYQLKLFDLIRIDHFRGFEAYWEVPADEETAINGRWVKAPGDQLFDRLHEEFDPLPVIAEDLGIITEEVEALRLKYGLPGMKILQFAFDSGADNPYLPHNLQRNSVVYTGTHDNNTTLGWFDELSPELQAHIGYYLADQSESMPWLLIRAALASVSRLAIVPMQDLMALDASQRMNTPGTTEGNWGWRFQWSELKEGTAERLNELVIRYGR
ncbi:4-alpha-glucanotransferase [Solemya pervernicosa gill symbiont]|uniref:4-alpha-glucanotransferase n=2 Tax=Gammaproteobacteria incertae sedis TaxID=118884 RepID=A0A1T2LAM2_9GAMM|nr:4-alpha-glucanotransferase [Candidatus Reidiella endopervernicosa]OOZ42158.1 4-alpha-glucanotransferase [Solemya pervernicosa gill symbiont]QKQ27275.1 4-alpha-glucanotransferase [Candidatus Reidiella endopervernicosa]